MEVKVSDIRVSQGNNYLNCQLAFVSRFGGPKYEYLPEEVGICTCVARVCDCLTFGHLPFGHLPFGHLPFWS